MPLRVLALPLAAALVLFAACAGGPPPVHGEAGGPVPELTVKHVLAPVGGPAEADLELARLERQGQAPAAVLRRAYVSLRTGDTEHSLRILNELLFGATAPSTAVESFAYYVRALVWERKGDDARAAADRRQAAALALDEELARLARGSAARPATGETTAGVAPLRLHARKDWRARAAEPRQMDPMGRVTRITVHHSGMLARDDAAGAATAIRAIQRQHMEQRGYGDIGYHLLIDRDGELWDGRDRRWQGAHAHGTNNHGNVGICLLGNFVAGSEGQRPSGPQLDALARVLREMCGQYRLDPSRCVYTHRELRDTECPGEYLQVVMDRLRRDWGKGERVAGTQ